MFVQVFDIVYYSTVRGAVQLKSEKLNFSFLSSANIFLVLKEKGIRHVQLYQEP